MGRASFLTPVYFFTSTRSASGKASIVANLATHLNNLGEKIAIVDLDSGTPLKLKSSFSQAITLQEYSDISTLPHTQDSRYQKNFYFSDTTLISYFPAFNLTSSIHLFNDAVLRDFFIQLKSSFDVVMVNFPSGTQYSQQVSELLSRNYLWRGNRPLSLILSQPDEKSIILLDTLIKENPALYYQLNENTALVFNRVPATPEDQSLAERTLNNLEIRKLFNYPFIFVSPINDEFSSHRLQESPAVLKTNSLLHQTISGFQRFLSFMNSSPGLETTEKTSEYQPCLDGELLEKLSPHLEKIQIAAAARLFVTPDELQVFLEESPGNYRIRIRMSGVTNTISGIPREIAVAPDYPRIFRASPGQFGFANTDNTATSASIMDREKPSCLSVKPVFRFDDRFAKDTDFNIAQTIVMQPEKSSYPSPILFKSSADLPDIPSLGHILGFATQKNRHFDFICDWQLFKIPGVTHFFIPPEFAFKFRNYCPLFHNHAITVETVNRDIFNHNARYHLSPLTRQFESQAPAEPVLLNSISGSKLELSPEHDFLPRFKFARLKDLPVENRPPKRFSHQTYKINICQSPLETRTENFYTNLGLYGKSTLALHIQNTCKKIDDGNFTLFSTKSDPYTPALFLLKASTDAKLLWKPATRDESFCLTKEKVNSRFIQHDFAEFIKKELDFNIAAFNCIRNYEDPVFNIENVSSKNENYHQPATPVLPAKFASEILLLEHGLNALLKDMPIKSGYFYQARTRLGYTPQHPLFFKLGFSYPAFSPIQNSFVADRTNIAQIFHLTDFAFSSIQHVLKSDSSFLCRDILPIYSNLKKEPEYKDFPSTRIYRTDFLLDAEMETRALKPVKNQMHLIRPAISEFPQPASKSRTRKLRPKYNNLAGITVTSDFFRDETGSAAQRMPLYETEMSAVSHSYEDYSIVAAENYRNILTPAKGVAQHFATPDFTLLTVPMPSRQLAFFQYKGEKMPEEIKNTPDELNTPICPLLIPINQYHYMPPRANLRIARTIPMRSKKLETPKLIETPPPMHLRFAYFGTQVIDSVFEDFSVEMPSFASIGNYSIGYSIPKSFPLKVQATRTFKKLAAPEISFIEQFPETIEIFYRHLLWCFASVKRRKFAISTASAVVKQPLEHLSEFALSDIVFKEAFKDKSRSRQERMFVTKHRESITIANTRFNDLLNLVRQASQRFKEIKTTIQP